MDKRLAKRHQRKVNRARERVRISEPDVRTPEQIAAARLASRPDLRQDTKAAWPTLPSDNLPAKDAAPETPAAPETAAAPDQAQSSE